MTSSTLKSPPLDGLSELAGREVAYLLDLYTQLHQFPELSLHEKNTAQRISAELRSLGFAVTRQVGGHGLVGILENGDGPTILIRTDMDALPVTEETGKPYASKVIVENGDGQKTGVMHACGHDMHMTVWTGTARLLAALKDRWEGTLVFVAQPAEEIGIGAKSMLADGLFKRFPLPDCALALHVNSELPAGTLAYTPEYTFANVELLDIIVHGKGGHGAYPRTTKDPILLASRIVVALHNITSTETSPLDPAIITVGSIHGGTNANVVPGEVRLSLAVRSYSDEVHQTLLREIKRICDSMAMASGLPEDQYPTITSKHEMVPAVYNDPELTHRISQTFKRVFGEENVRRVPPAMTGEDFGHYGRTEEKVPVFLYWLGAVESSRYEAARAGGTPLPSLHNSKFAPDPELTIKTGITAMSAAVLDLLGQLKH